MINLYCSCGTELSVKRTYLQCPSCKNKIQFVDGIPRFVKMIDDGFDYRWKKNPLPQPTTAKQFWEKTGWSYTYLQGMTVLDAGCGIGRFSRVAADAGATIIAVDGSNCGVAQTNKLVPGASVIQADLSDLSMIHDESVDMAFSLGVLHHTADPEAVFAQMARKVKPDGRIAVWVYCCHALNPEHLPLIEWLHAITSMCPPEKLYEACEKYAVKIRDVSYPRWDRLEQVIRPSYHPDDTECVSDFFDWHCPQIRSWHTVDEVKSWFENNGCEVTKVGEFPVSVSGVKL